MKLKVTAVFLLLVFIASCGAVAEARGGGGAKGGGRAGSVKSAPKATSKPATVKTTPVNPTTQNANKTTAQSATANSGGFASRVKSWFGGRQAGTTLHRTPATPVNNYYYSNGHYNGWSGLFWGYLMGRALAPHSYPAQQQAGEYTLSGGQAAAPGEYTWEEPTLGENIVAYGVLILIIVLIVLVLRLIYKFARRRLAKTV